ncbi:MAG: 3-dehydroquinate synthase [Candidatus Tectomicrobia bacterium RIFCSPLOWO2_12_FULL_69_37]|nr:MAG: 3-dehydroquinate synthase [Candidatus Tectomicrobia bacterium RIFCSPLOWO2_02_FULL_70_19]OGL65978.1 MAG: 3-dehydroquinate synthase [Candidatus Tectomicrobia bacterium RIFCSPLOWO2_12_FULL_69_37]
MRMVRVAFGERSYTIWIGASALRRLGETARACFPGGRALVVSDRNVARRYGPLALASLRKSGIRAEILAVPAGERSKSLAQLSRIFDRLAALQLDRGCGLVALGGGVIGDLGGFAAAAFLRGIPCIQAPTSLLAQVDSSVGGKTGVDHRLGKNLIGAFYQPAAVLSDIASLDTLPAREFRSGMAEVVKHAVIADAGLFAYLERNAARIQARDKGALERVVAENCRLKARIVERDERESGPRMALNFGHTLGHAIETLAGYSRRLLHGEAVAIGMAAAARLSREEGLCAKEDVERLTALLGGFGLPTSLRRPPAQPQLAGAVGSDKKRLRGKPRFVLLERIGKVRYGCELSSRDWRPALAGRAVKS